MTVDLVDEAPVAEGVLADEEAQVGDEAVVAEGTGVDDFYAGLLPCITRSGRPFNGLPFLILPCNNNMYD